MENELKGVELRREDRKGDAEPSGTQ